VTTVHDIAKFCQVTPRRVQQLVKEKLLPMPEKAGEYDFMSTVHAFIAYLHRLQRGEAGDFAIERTRLTRAQADKAEIDLAEKKGMLVPVAMAEQVWSSLIANARSILLTLPDRAAIKVVGKTEVEAEKAIRDLIYEALTELSNWKPNEYDYAEYTEDSGVSDQVVDGVASASEVDG